MPLLPLLGVPNGLWGSAAIFRPRQVLLLSAFRWFFLVRDLESPLLLQASPVIR